MTHYGASAREKIPTIAAGAFANIPSTEDKEWAEKRTKQLYPPVVSASATSQAAGNQNDNATAIAAAAGLNAKMLEMMKGMMDGNVSAGPRQSGMTGTKVEEEALKNTWHGKLGMSKSSVAHLLRFCGLKEGQEHLLPKLWFRLGEKGMETVNRQRKIRRVLENNKT